MTRDVSLRTTQVGTHEELENYRKNHDLVDFDSGGRRLSVNESRGYHNLLLSPLYDNIAIGKMGASLNAAYLLGKDGETTQKIRPVRSVGVYVSSNFVVINRKLYHIPSGCCYEGLDEPASKLLSNDNMSSVVTVRGKQKHFSYNGTQIMCYTEDVVENVDLDDMSKSYGFRNVFEEITGEKDGEENTDNGLTNAESSYKSEIRDIVENKPHVINSDEAERYLNEEIEFTENKRARNEFMNNRARYTRLGNDYDESEWDDFLVYFFDKYNQFVHVTGADSDTQVSDFEDDFKEEFKEKQTEKDEDEDKHDNDLDSFFS